MNGELTLNDIINNPTAFGAPTFDEYCKAPDKYKKGLEDMLNIAQGGPTGDLRRITRDVVYYIEGYKVKTLEKVEQIAKDHGWDFTAMDIKPEMEKTTNGRYIFHVYFVQKGKDASETDQGR